MKYEYIIKYTNEYLKKINKNKDEIKKYKNDIYILFILYIESLKNFDKYIDIIRIIRTYIYSFLLKFMKILIKFNIEYNDTFNKNENLLIDIENIDRYKIICDFLDEYKRNRYTIIFIIRLLYIYNTTNTFDFYINELYKKLKISYTEDIINDRYINKLLYDMYLKIYGLLKDLNIYNYNLDYKKTGGYNYFEYTILNNII